MVSSDPSVLLQGSREEGVNEEKIEKDAKVRAQFRLVRKPERKQFRLVRKHTF